MICLRCGYCCIHYDVIIVDNPQLGITKGNLKHKKTGEKCQHLKGEKAGEYKCSIHDKPWYKETPCFNHGQVEKRKDCECRMGKHILEKEKSNDRTNNIDYVP